MATKLKQLRFLTDNNVPDSVGDYLRGRGHSVHRVRHQMPDNSPDNVVATAALANERILITQDRDFNAQRFAQDRFASLSRLGLVGPGPTLVAAIRQHIHLIELQWAHASRIKARMIVQVQIDKISFRS